MAKKKRDKKYTGWDAAQTKPKVTKITVPNRSPIGKFWHENRQKLARRLAIIGTILILYSLVSWIF